MIVPFETRIFSEEDRMPSQVTKSPPIASTNKLFGSTNLQKVNLEDHNNKFTVK